MDVVDGGSDLLICWFDAEELNQVLDDFFGAGRKFGELDLEDGHIGMSGDEGVAMFKQTALQFFALLVSSGEPLAAIFLAGRITAGTGNLIT